jgi:hypothetical protein
VLELELLGGWFCGVLLEPAPAEPLGLVGALLDEDEDDPPLAWSFLLRSIEVDEELELGGVAVVPPADDEDDEPGVVVAPDEGEVEDELDERSAPRSQAAISDAPSARETATAIVDNLMWPPWLGYKDKQQGSGRDCYVSTRGASVLRQFLIVGFVSLLCGPEPSPRC